MTPKQRTEIALSGGMPDRVPTVLEFDFDYLVKISGLELWQYTYGDGLTRACMQEALFLRHPTDLWLCRTGPSIARQQQREIVRHDGQAYYLDKRTGRRFRLTAAGDLLGDHGQPVALGPNGEVYDKTGTNAPLSARHPRPIESEADIVEALGPTPPVSYWIEDGWFATIQHLLPRYGEERFLAFTLNNIFAQAVDLFGGYEEGLVAMASNPRLFHRALEAITAQKLSRLRAGASLGAPGVWLISYYAGADTISPRSFEEFVLPYKREVVREAQRLGLKVWIWFLGDVMPMLPHVVAIGPDGLFPEQGRKGYEVDMAEVRRRVGDRMCLIGFNSEADLIAGRRAALTRGIAEQIEGAGGDGAFIMGTTILNAEVDPEHLDFYLATTREVGRYPLRR